MKKTDVYDLEVVPMSIEDRLKLEELGLNPDDYQIRSDEV